MVNSPSPWAAALAAFLAVTTYDLSLFCTQDPPALAVPSAADWSLFLGTVGFGNSAPQSVRDFFAYYAWFTFCKCDAGAPPAAAASSPPAGLPQVNPPVGGVTATPCLTADSGTGFHFTSAGGSTMISQAFGAITPTSMLVTAITSHHTGAGATIQVTVDQGYGSPEVPGTQTVLQCPTAGTTTLVVPIDKTAAYYTITGHGVAGSGDSNVQVLTSVFCNGQPALGPVTPCCPPDPLIVAQLGAVLQMVTLLQRRLSPFAYIPGAVHSGLSGQGTFTINGLIGLKIAITTVPASYGEAVAEPTFRFLDSWVSVLTSDGLIDERRITALAQVWTPRIASESTVWGYSFGPGIVASITELEAEP
jgi:hypothetical protein